MANSHYHLGLRNLLSKITIMEMSNKDSFQEGLTSMIKDKLQLTKKSPDPSTDNRSLFLEERKN